MNEPLKDFLVIDFSQFLSGPSASLKLSDLGAKVIKIERPAGGDICRDMYISNVDMNGESSVFHAINRNKESFSADLKNEMDKNSVWQLVKKADVVIHNFRPGVMQRLGFDYDSVKQVNPNVVYGEISGYGKEGPWRNKPGQDLLVQALSGLTWLNGSAGEGPVPMGLAVVDILTGANLAEGILACLVRKGIHGKGGLVQVSMIESAIDFQFETITTFHYEGELTKRSKRNNAHSYLGAPYGIYETKDGYLALAMGLIPQLGELLDCEELHEYTDSSNWFTKRDEIKAILANHLKKASTQYWLDILESADIWCAEVLTWDRLTAHDGFRFIDMIQKVTMEDGCSYLTTRCPISIDGEKLTSNKGAPKLGEHTERIKEELISELVN